MTSTPIFDEMWAALSAPAVRDDGDGLFAPVTAPAPGRAPTATDAPPAGVPAPVLMRRPTPTHRSTSMVEARLSVEVVWLLTLAEQETTDLGHRRLGTEHLLLALVRSGDPAGRLLCDHGASLPALRRAIGGSPPPGALDAPDGRPGWSTAASAVLAAARRCALGQGRGETTPTDLVAVLLLSGGRAAALLDALEVDVDAVLRDLGPELLAA